MLFGGGGTAVLFGGGGTAVMFGGGGTAVVFGGGDDVFPEGGEGATFVSHVVADPLASSPAAFVVPAAHAVHALRQTNSFAEHKVVVVHVVSDPLSSSPAALDVPAAHAVHTLEETNSFAEHKVTDENTVRPVPISTAIRLSPISETPSALNSSSEFLAHPSPM